MDCHLTHASEIVIDNNDTVNWGVASFSPFQKRIARRVLQVRRMSFVDPLYTELGIWPIRERRLLLALKYLHRTLRTDEDLLAKWAVFQSFDLWCKGHSSWAGDVNNVHMLLARQPLPLPDVWIQDGGTLERLKRSIYSQMVGTIERRIADNHRLFLLHDRREPQKDDNPKVLHLGLRHYLTQVSNPSHRRAITKLIFGEDSYRLHAEHDRIAREDRVCRKCQLHVESPQHVLLQCSADLLTCALRRNLLELLQTQYSILVPTVEQWITVHSGPSWHLP
jgi:hypothetical protein